MTTDDCGDQKGDKMVKKFNISLKNGAKTLTEGASYAVRYVWYKGASKVKELEQDFRNYKAGQIEDVGDEKTDIEGDDTTLWINVKDARTRI